jgi:hypothetical protein
MHTYIHTCIDTCTHAYTYVCTHTYIYTYMQSTASCSSYSCDTPATRTQTRDCEPSHLEMKAKTQTWHHEYSHADIDVKTQTQDGVVSHHDNIHVNTGRSSNNGCSTNANVSQSIETFENGFSKNENVFQCIGSSTTWTQIPNSHGTLPTKTQTQTGNSDETYTEADMTRYCGGMWSSTAGRERGSRLNRCMRRSELRCMVKAIVLAVAMAVCCDQAHAQGPGTLVKIEILAPSLSLYLQQPTPVYSHTHVYIHMHIVCMIFEYAHIREYVSMPITC